MVQRGNVRVAVATRHFPKVCRAINAYGPARLPSWFTRTAVQVNHAISPSSTMPRHKHPDHLPFSAIVTVGDFSGGEVCVEEAGIVFTTRGIHPYTMACVAVPEGHDSVDEDGVVFDAHKEVVFCSGALHMPAPWLGERWCGQWCELWKGRVRAVVRGAYAIPFCIVHVAVLARTRWVHDAYDSLFWRVHVGFMKRTIRCCGTYALKMKRVGGLYAQSYMLNVALVPVVPIHPPPVVAFP